MKNLGYYNGKFGPLDEISVPMLDRACFFGDGVYDAACSRNHKIFALDEHIDRFFNSANLLRINISQTKQELKRILCEMVLKVDDGEQLVYWQVSRGVALRNHAFPEQGTKPSLWIMLNPFKCKDLTQPVNVISVEDTRFLHCNAKTLNLLPNVLAAQKAKEADCYEAILHRGDRVTECTHNNVHILKNGVLITAPTDNLILPGITRKHLLELCKRLGIPVEERPYNMQELFAADEVLISSSGVFCAQVSQVDGVFVGGKATNIVKLLQKELTMQFMEATEMQA